MPAALAIVTASGPVAAAAAGSPFAALFAPYVEGEIREWALAAGLDSRGRLVSFFGLPDEAASNGYLHVCATAALCGRDVAALVVAHNHPAGPARASSEDIAATRRVAALCRLAGARLLDHLILAPEGVFSFRQAGLMH